MKVEFFLFVKYFSNMLKGYVSVMFCFPGGYLMLHAKRSQISKILIMIIRLVHP